MPRIIYGTAWKEDSTTELVRQALEAGFRGIDTANQKKHYREDFVGQAISEMIGPKLKREDLFLQSKFTYRQSQDHRLPYDPDSSLTDQVAASIKNTFENLDTTYLDSYLIHGPSSMDGLTDNDWEVWDKLEDLYDHEKVLRIGISNVALHHLEELFENAKVRPTVVQNRCYAVRNWDQDVREFCLENQIVYQGFSLLTANQQVVNSPQVAEIAKRLGKTFEHIILRFATQIGILPLTGTTDPNHMLDDLNIFDFELEAADIKAVLSATR